MSNVLLEMKDITKTFPGVHALDHFSFNLCAGEVHALVGGKWCRKIYINENSLWCVCT